MKNLIILACIAVFAVTGCSKAPEPMNQGYTSFVFWHNEDITLTNSVVGYFPNDGLCHKLVELGDIPQGYYTPEFIVEDESIDELYFFCDNYSDGINMAIKLKQTFILQKNQKNTFKIDDKGSDNVRKSDPKQYPQ
jgi:hypothetical protein